MVRWLNDRGYPFEFEPDWGVSKSPDFRVHHGNEVVAIEVKTIEEGGLLKDVRPGDHGFRKMKDALKPLRGKIRDAAPQLKPLAGSGIPLVIAISNPHKRPVPDTVEFLMSAMYGDPTYRFARDGGAGRALLGLNGKLKSDHPYISAVALVREVSHDAEAAGRWHDENRSHFASPEEMIAAARRLGLMDPAGTRVAVDLVDTVTDAPRVPAMFVAGPDDSRWSLTADRSGLTRW